MRFLLNLGASIATSREPKDFWNQLLVTLEANVHEVPFVMLYSADTYLEDTLSTISERGLDQKEWVLEGSLGYSSTYPHVSKVKPDGADLFLPSFKTLIRSATPTLLKRSDQSLPESLINGVESRAFGDRCESAVFLPIRSTGENVLGFMILGVNPRRPYNIEYQTFVQLLNRQLATAMASAVLFEEELRRSRIAAELAAQDRDELSGKLATRTQEARELETRFKKMADLAPVGIFHFDAAGVRDQRIAPDGDNS